MIPATSPISPANPMITAMPPGGAGPIMPGGALVPGDGSQPASGFAGMLQGLVSTVGAKEAAANELTRQVLLGQTGQLHQSVIAMQEATTALSLMVQVRNKLVESYQELMRMQV